ncbi:MAG: NAD(P)-dependent oxidoreductase [Myxococcota bacterium]|nr:NAD(P)-dependent oxidoreductase [Myxococcota bacterium]
MHIFVAGATGAIGRELLPMLAGHVVTGMTRSRADLVRSLGAAPIVADIYDRDRTLAVVAAALPDVVVHLLTDLSARDFTANARIRRVGTRHLLDAAKAANARRIVLESISFSTSPEGARAVAEMEACVTESGMETVVVRLARLWGPGTWHELPEPNAEFIHVRDAARLFFNAIIDGARDPSA